MLVSCIFFFAWHVIISVHWAFLKHLCSVVSGRYEHYSGEACAVTKCKADLKLGYYFLARNQHSVKNPKVDPGCVQKKCSNKNPAKGEIYIPGAKEDKCNIFTCDIFSYIKDPDANKCEPCPDGMDCDGTTKAPTKASMLLTC